MAEELIAYSLAEHPAPHRDRVSLWSIFYSLFAAPIFWAGDLMVDFALVSHACYPGHQPLAAPTEGFGWVWAFVLAAGLVTLLLIASGGLVALRNWRVTGPPHGHHHHLVEKGEGRTRYLGICGMGFALFFFVVTVTMTVALFFLPLCSL
jgi:hypothetical protein